MPVGAPALVAVLITLVLLGVGLIWGEVLARRMVRRLRADLQWLITGDDSGTNANQNCTHTTTE